MWQLELFTGRNTLQIVHSVSGKVVLKQLEQLSPCLSRISREVKCTFSECELQTFLLIQALATNHHQNGTFTVFPSLFFIPLPPQSYTYHEHKVI